MNNSILAVIGEVLLGVYNAIIYYKKIKGEVTMTQEEKFKEAKRLYETANADQRYVLEKLFPELRESENERIKKEIMDFIDTKTIESDERRNRWFSYLEKYKPISFTSLEDTKVKMSLMQYISELNQDVVHLHPDIETCNEWIAYLERQRK